MSNIHSDDAQSRTPLLQSSARLLATERGAQPAQPPRQNRAQDPWGQRGLHDLRRKRLGARRDEDLFKTSTQSIMENRDVAGGMRSLPQIVGHGGRVPPPWEIASIAQIGQRAAGVHSGTKTGNVRRPVGDGRNGGADATSSDIGEDTAEPRASSGGDIQVPATPQNVARQGEGPADGAAFLVLQTGRRTCATYPSTGSAVEV